MAIGRTGREKKCDIEELHDILNFRGYKLALVVVNRMTMMFVWLLAMLIVDDESGEN